MAYISIETCIRTHRKFLAAGPAASWLWVCGLCYCQEGLTDGFVPDAALDFLGVKGARRLATVLVDAGLWVREGHGWRMHDYLKHNRSADDVRRIMKARADGGAKGGRPARQTSKDNLQGFTNTTPEPNLLENPFLPSSTSDLPSDRPDDAREPDAVEPVWRLGPRRAGAHTRTSLVASHLRCDAATSAACQRGICVPPFLASQWRTQLDPDTTRYDATTAAIAAFVDAVLVTLPDGPVGDDPLAFWRACWKVAHGSQAPAASSTKGSRTAAAFDDAHNALERTHAKT